MVLSKRWIDFMQSGVSIVAASRDAANVASLARACGCRLSKGNKRVTILIYAPQATPVLEAIKATKTIAVIFSQPSTHASIQVKGTDAEIGGTVASDRDLIDRCTDGFAKDAATIGYSELGIQTLLWHEFDDVVSITFTPEAAFLQTPGPRAGEPLEA